MTKYDFAGWATRNDLRCADGRTIRKDAFKDNDGQTVPLVWNHQHNDPLNVLGHALLENREKGVYAYCQFNDTEAGQSAKELVQHGDITALSIYANQLKQNGGNVLHGAIREVSLVLAGANPGAFIDSVMSHSGTNSDEEAIIYTGENLNVLMHSDTEEDDEMGNEERTIADVFDEMTEEQQEAVYAVVGAVLDGVGDEVEEDEDEEFDDEDLEELEEFDDEEEFEDMSHNAFENNYGYDDDVLMHSEMMEILDDGAKYGSLRESALAHGITNIDYLFPDAENLNKEPGLIGINPSAWVQTVMNGVHHTPFSRIKMMFANITADEARAKGYIKGNKKVSEVFPLLKREITPTTIYKKQELDRDDVIDITDFDVVAWIKREMRTKLDEEIARAVLFGDGRQYGVDNDAINPTCIIPVAKDTAADLYCMSKTVTPDTGESKAHALIRTIVKAMDEYEGSGNTVFFTSSGNVSDFLLMEDAQGHRLYKSLQDVAVAMSVEKIVKVPASIIPAKTIGVILDLKDYNMGADKGGSVNMFDDFDIDYNKQKYLIETRCSGGLTKPHSAIVLVEAEG